MLYCWREKLRLTLESWIAVATIAVQRLSRAFAYDRPYANLDDGEGLRTLPLETLGSHIWSHGGDNRGRCQLLKGPGYTFPCDACTPNNYGFPCE